MLEMELELCMGRRELWMSRMLVNDREYPSKTSSCGAMEDSEVDFVQALRFTNSPMVNGIEEVACECRGK